MVLPCLPTFRNLFISSTVLPTLNFSYISLFIFVESHTSVFLNRRAAARYRALVLLKKITAPRSHEGCEPLAYITQELHSSLFCRVAYILLLFVTSIFWMHYSVTLVCIYRNPENHNINIHRCENLKSKML
jgi:hypothetical protein